MCKEKSITAPKKKISFLHQNEKKYLANKRKLNERVCYVLLCKNLIKIIRQYYIIFAFYNKNKHFTYK